MIDKKFTSGVSLIICCYNSASRLPKTIEHIQKQLIAGSIACELIIVNNCSTDNTIQVASAELEKHSFKFPFKIIDEPKAGLSFARQSGAKAAQFNILIFCDDDNWLDENYVSNAFEIMEADKNIGILGGKSDAFFEAGKPGWFDEFQNVYVVGNPLPSSGLANERKYITGAGMVIRKDIFNLLKGLSFSSVLTDRKGKGFSSGGDSELCLLALYLGYDLYYDERLVFTHYITKERLNWAYCVKMVSKGFALPQFQFYLYDYCFKTMMANQQPSFEYTYKRNIRKPLQAVLQYFKGFRSFFATIKLLFFSQPGSRKEIEIKTNFNKLFYVLTHKKKLQIDFNTICMLMVKIKKERQLV